MTLDEINELLPKVIADAIQTDLINEHKDYYSNSSEREVARLYLMKEFLEAGAKSVDRSQQGAIIDCKYLVAWQKNKWRVLNRHNWYYYKNPKHLYENYFKEKEYFCEDCIRH
jgi:hypothetical protein